MTFDDAELEIVDVDFETADSEDLDGVIAGADVAGDFAGAAFDLTGAALIFAGTASNFSGEDVTGDFADVDFNLTGAGTTSNLAGAASNFADLALSRRFLVRAASGIFFRKSSASLESVDLSGLDSPCRKKTVKNKVMARKALNEVEIFMVKVGLLSSGQDLLSI